MLLFSSNARIFICGDPVNMHQSFEGLCHLAETLFQESPTEGAYFAFFNRKRDKVKVLYWDGDGLSIWYKRLEKGHFFRQKTRELPFSRKDFFLLLEGIIPQKIQPRFSLK